MMDINCKNCKSNKLILENCEQICTDCGEVQDELVDEGRLCILPDNETIEDAFRNKEIESNDRLTHRIRGEAGDAESRRRITREKLLDESRKIVKQLVKHPAAIDETMDLIKSTFQTYKGRLICTRKLGLIGACIYYLSAKHQLGTTLADVCKTLNIKMKVMTVCLKEVKLLCPNFEYERPNIRDLVKKFIDQMSTKYYDLPATDRPGDSQRQPLIDQKDKVVLQNRVILLIDLFEATHPYNQPTPRSLIAAVVYHAWRSLDTFKMIAIGIQNLSYKTVNSDPQDNGNNNQLVTTTIDNSAPQDNTDKIDEKVTTRVKHSIGYEKFCQICNIKYSKNGYKVVCKLQSSLIMLGKCLGDVNKITLPWFLKDIIENSPHLIQEHLRSNCI